MMATLRRLLSYSFLMVFLTAGIQVQAHAELIGTDQLAAQVSSQQKRDALKTLIARKDVRNQLVALGVDPIDAAQRVNQLSRAEVNSLYQKVSDLPAGGSALATVAVVLLILVLLDVTGITDIFPGI